MRIRTFVTFFLGSILVVSGCNRVGDPLDRAARLQRQGQPAKALTIYQSQLPRTADLRKQSQITVHIGECYAQLGNTPEAFSSYLSAAELDPQNAQAHFHLGEIYLMAGELERADQEASLLLKSREANSADAFSLIGAAAQAADREDIARDAYERVIKLEPGRMQVALNLAELYNRNGETAKARKVLTDVAAAKPKSPLPWLTLGRLEEQEGNIKAAEDDYKRAVSIESTPDTNLRLAQFYERSARVLDARTVLQRVDRLRPEMPTALPDFNLASGNFAVANDGYLAALQSARPAEDSSHKLTRRELVARLIESDVAKANTDSVSDRNAAIASARQHLATYGKELDEADRSLLEAELSLADDDLAQAAVSATQALEKAPQSPSAHYVAGIVRYRSSDTASARNEWQQAIELDATFIPARLALAEDSLHQDDATGAQELILPVVRQEPSNIQALIIFARTLIASHEYDSARNITVRIQSLAPRSPYPHILRGEAAAAAKNYASALVEFQQAVLLDTHSGDAIDGLTRLYSTADITRPMLLNMERIGMADPRSATLLEITGRNFINLHLYGDAERCLRESIAVDPGRRSAAEWLARVQAHNGDLSSASRSVARVREFSPMLAGVEAEQQHNLAAAIANYDKAVRAGDPTGVAANNLAWIFAQQHRELDRALALANKASELQADNPAVLDTVGFVHLARREYTDAISVLEKAQKIASLKSYSDQAVLAGIRQHLGEAYILTGQPERAQLLASNTHR